MQALRAPTLTLLHDRLCDRLVTSPEDKLDVITSVDVQIHNVIAEAASMEWDFNLKNMWLTPSRWSMMINQYIDPEELEAWIGQCTGKIGTRGRGIAVMRTKTVKARGGAATGHSNKETRRWGSCMLAVSYKAKPRPQITLYSRTSYLGYIGALDLSVAWMCGRYLAKEMGISVEDISFVWMNEAVQWHNFKSLAYLLNHHDEDKRTDYRAMLMASPNSLTREQVIQIKSAPALFLSRKWLRKVLAEDEAGRTYGDMTYNTFRRIVRRFHTEVLGYESAKEFEGWSYYKQGEKAGEQKEFFKAYQPLPSTPISTLDFGKLGMPITRSYGEPFVEGVDEDDDDDE
ncbi:MAG TPA: hypothetical protein VJQ25_11755 [Nitrospira sp.]|nr:hypothetical protein [Nitrospira sp.]